jgi:hypothetical protein
MLAFETNSSSAHEDTNHGMKLHSQPTNPQDTIVDVTNVLCDQAARSERKLTWTVVRKIASKSLHSILPTANTLTDLGNGLVEKQWRQAKHYNICGPNGHQWLCMRRADTSAKGAVPKGCSTVFLSPYSVVLPDQQYHNRNCYITGSRKMVSELHVTF